MIIKGAIPDSVTHLTFGSHFNQDIQEAIPNSIIHLTFSINFDKKNRIFIGYIP